MLKRRRLLLSIVSGGQSSGGGDVVSEDVTILFSSSEGCLSIWTCLFDTYGNPIADELVAEIGDWSGEWWGYQEGSATLKSGVTYLLMPPEGCYPSECTISYTDGRWGWLDGDHWYDYGKQNVVWFTCEVGMESISIFSK
jgi:hypothetical protein